MSYMLRVRVQEHQCEQIKADGQRQVTVVSMESDRCVLKNESHYVYNKIALLCSLTHEANKKILELKDTVASLSVSLCAKDEKILELKEALDSNKEV